MAAAAYEAIGAQRRLPASALLPTLPKVAGTLVDMLADGSMLRHAAYTLYRMLTGFALAVVVGLPLGILMGRVRAVEGFFLPLMSALMPIPSLAWVPVFILWFGLGNTVAVLVVLLCRHVSRWCSTPGPACARSTSSGCAPPAPWGRTRTALFWKVMLPGAAPFIITGLRQAFLRSWIAVVGAEMIAASDWGLGWVIYDAKEFLNADVMLASLAVIGAIGFAFERLVFGSLERATVLRWGMVRAAQRIGARKWPESGNIHSDQGFTIPLGISFLSEPSMLDGTCRCVALFVRSHASSERTGIWKWSSRNRRAAPSALPSPRSPRRSRSGARCWRHR